MEQTVTANITGYGIRIEPLDEGYKDQMITVVAIISDSYGNVIGEMETDVFEIARNIPLALLKAYQIRRKIDKGTLIPSTDN